MEAACRWHDGGMEAAHIRCVAAGRLQESKPCGRLCGRILFEGGREMNIRTGALAVLAAAIAAVLSVASASAASAGAVSVTQHLHNEVIFSDPTVNPCTGAPGTITGTAKTGVFHMTTLANGTFHLTGTAQGTITFIPDNPADASASGHFASWFGENGNLQNGAATSTFNTVLSGSDGSRIGTHEVFHISTSASGGTITFDKPHLTCG
jgi:hypothetical protein